MANQVSQRDFAIVRELHDAGTRVLIRRSDGMMQLVTITEPGQTRTRVGWPDASRDGGAATKLILTEDIVSLNPSLFTARRGE